MRIALVHDWLTGLRGGERVLDVLARRFPDADLYTLVHVPGSTTAAIDALRVHESPLARIPGARRNYRPWLPLFPWAISRFALEGYDLVISSSHAVAKGIPIRDGTPHLCYCHTPMRFVWDQTDAYLGRGLRRALASPLIRALRAYDVTTSRSTQVTRFIANSECVRERIRRHYGRESAVIAPPVRLNELEPRPNPRRDYYLLVAGFVPYKREELALEAFRRSGRRLIVVGDGPARSRLEAAAAKNVEFTGRVSDVELAELYGHCRALIYPQEEDFGIVALEAQASGRPVVAFAGGGALDTVVPLDGHDPEAAGATGLFFHSAQPRALNAAIEAFEKAEHRFDPRAIRRHAERFSEANFLAALGAEIAATAGASRP